MADQESRDIVPLELPSLSWRSADASASLEAVYAHVVESAERTIRWYQKRKRSKRYWAQILRVCAVALTTLGGILPVLSQMSESNSDWSVEPAWASVAFSAALAAIGLDRFFGFSSGWSRYASTALAIHSALENFQIGWQEIRAQHPDEPVTPSVASLLLGSARAFSQSVATLIETETDSWIAEFTESLATMEAKADRKLPGRSNAGSS